MAWIKSNENREINEMCAWRKRREETVAENAAGLATETEEEAAEASETVAEEVKPPTR